jgi:glutamine synthetase
MTPSEIVKRIQEEGIEFVDFQFGDLFGTLNHFTVPAQTVTEEDFEDGKPFDGSSIRAWKGIEKSDMIFMPDATTAYLDPFRKVKTLCIIGDIWEPRTGELYPLSPRSVAKKALDYLASQGIGDLAFFGPEPEFFVFDSISFSSQPNAAFYEINSNEASWTSGEPEENGHKIGFKGGYFPVSPNDTLMDLRTEMVQHLITMGVDVEIHHHEVGTAGQCEIGTKFGTIISAGDQVHKLKYAVKNTAAKYGKTATFMPKPLFGDNGSGMHVHTSVWKEGKNIFAGDGYGNLSEIAIHAIGGILKHGRSIQPFTNPSANSYRRLVPGYEAPVRLAYSATNRSASVRIPYVSSEKARRFEFRCPDSSGSPYLAFAAMLMAMIDGIKNKIDPGAPMDKNIYDLPPEELATMVSTCSGLEEAIQELEADKDWLMAGDVFPEELINSYLAYRKEKEVEPLKLRPNPLEFELYYSC